MSSDADPDTSGRVVLVTTLAVMLVIAAGSFLGGVFSTLSLLGAVALAVVLGGRLLPSRYHGHAAVASYAVLVGLLLWG